MYLYVYIQVAVMGAKGAVEILYKSQSAAEVEARTADYMVS